MSIRFPFLFFILVVGILYISCTREDFDFSSGARLEFSTDTLTFDTVFTTIGSVTKRFTVINPGRHTVNVSKIFLAGRNTTPFRLNINGVTANEESDVAISGGDSIFIFVEVTIDPTGQNLPMVVHDAIVFNLNGNTQDVDLIAFGQDCHLFDGEVLKSQVWNNDKPYLIYNSVLVDSLETLTISEGCRIHFHKGSSMFVKGTLKATGTYEAPIKFQGDRLEEMYADVPGQWGASAILDNGGIYVYGGLHFLKGSMDNTIDWVIIKNADKGIQVDSLGASPHPVLTISNSRIENMSLNCLDARTTRLKASNTVFANSGSNTVILRYGGDYDFNHCTIANYFNFGPRREPALVFNNYFEYKKEIYSFDFNAFFGNCIVYGKNVDEFYMDEKGNKTFNRVFKNCLIKTALYSGNDFENIIFNKDPRFVDIFKSDFTIDSQSPAKDMGNIEIAKLYPFDLKNQSRLEDSGPDIGAYEWTENLEQKEK
jgi:hypothetical protein